jgi:hypothetical protein
MPGPRKLSRLDGGGAFGEVRNGGDVGVVGGDSFDQASDRESVANPAGAADEMSGSAFASELDGDTNERGDAGTVDLRDAVEIDDDFAAATLNDGLKGLIELLGRLADGQTAAHLEEMDAVLFTNGDFHGQVFSHRDRPRETQAL